MFRNIFVRNLRMKNIYTVCTIFITLKCTHIVYTNRGIYIKGYNALYVHYDKTE